MKHRRHMTVQNLERLKANRAQYQEELGALKALAPTLAGQELVECKKLITFEQDNILSLNELIGWGQQEVDSCKARESVLAKMKQVMAGL